MREVIVGVLAIVLVLGINFAVTRKSKIGITVFGVLTIGVAGWYAYQVSGSIVKTIIALIVVGAIGGAIGGIMVYSKGK